MIAMFGTITEKAGAEKKLVRKELRLRREDENRIKAAAKAVGVPENDFILQATLKQADGVELNMHATILPAERFEAIKADVESSGEAVPGLVQLFVETKGARKNEE